MLNSEHSIAWNTAYSITYEDYAEIRTKLHDKKNPMQKSTKNNIKLVHNVQRSIMQSGMILCSFRRKQHAKRNYAVLKKKQHIGMILCSFQKKTACQMKFCCSEEETAYWNDFMQFSEENSMSNEIMLF